MRKGHCMFTHTPFCLKRVSCKNKQTKKSLVYLVICFLPSQTQGLVSGLISTQGVNSEFIEWYSFEGFVISRRMLGLLSGDGRNHLVSKQSFSSVLQNRACGKKHFGNWYCRIANWESLFLQLVEEVRNLNDKISLCLLPNKWSEEVDSL